MPGVPRSPIVTRRNALGLLGGAAFSASLATPALAHRVPEITQILVKKERRKLYLLHGRKAVLTYDIDLGFNPIGHKRKQGDGRTPEGLYRIDRRNPRSRYHLSLGIDYPRPRDRAWARARGLDPGGDIFIHGEAGHKDGPDWTAGCVAVPDPEIEEIYDLIPLGMPVMITA